MKKALLIVFLIQSLNQLQSQVNYFNNYYNPNGTWASGFNIYTINNGYIVCGIMGDSPIYYFKKNIIIVKIDNNGNIILSKEFKLDSADYYVGSYGGGGFTKCKNGGFLLSTDIVDLNDNIYTCFMRFNDNLDTLWTKYLSNNPVSTAVYHCIETFDNGFAICGGFGLKIGSDSYKFAYLTKTDSIGNIKYEKLYNITGGHNGDVFDCAWNITETPEKGFLLGCYTYFQYNSSIQGTGDGVIIKTDSLGNSVWIKNFGGNEKDCVAISTICNDSNYMIASILSTYTSQGNDVYKGNLHLIKIRPDGSVIWDKIYNPELYEITAMKVIQLANGDFIIGGAKDHQLSNGSDYYDSYLFKINSNGDSLWYRDLAIVASGSTLPDLSNLYNMALTSDGGVVGCGVTYVAGQIPYSMWVFKTDSLGCLQPGCQYVGIEELQKAKEGELKVYPKPATTQTTITYPMAEKDIMLQIYNMLGQLVYKEKLPKGSSQTNINTTALKPGLYKVVVGESSASLIINY